VTLVLLYDVHGNLPALEAVLEEAAAERPDGYLLGGDYGVPSPWPDETLKLLRALPAATWIRGNGERWLYEPPPDHPEIGEVYDRLLVGFPEQEKRALYELPERAELDGVLFVHGSPLSDVETFAPQPEDGEERLLAGERDRTIVFGHSHQQFRRAGPAGTTLVNPGSVGMPLDHDTRAAWAVWDGDVSFRRTAYDVAAAASAYRALGGEVSEWLAARLERGYDV
jgi:diadenosine tetraphosphatase ApaH/serine/threonine PP2A family protein phosphatase